MGFLKDPILRNKENTNNVNPAGDVFEEIREQDVVGAISWGTLLTTLSCLAASVMIGDKGQVCTGTVECQNNCRK
ncbi:plantaricin C family lantibiotic [Bacillus sp. CLL-7-23]|uniref:Plantaricin C family lantibiotic n=1 Tax=Bacillus changyiensis TaxID=3004103 RepID=A0ABT4X108_9BACI|nr:plantaricin C family lantibiotic [Bacillus changyiensis]MDA7025116.1 plantaricin C family lantibiotic [Bacillus changyiensis]